MVNPFFRPVTAGTASTTTFDAGLRQHMQRIYNYMAGGLAVTGAIAYVVAHTQLITLFFALSPDGQIHTTLLGMIAMFSPLVFLIYMQFKMQSMSLGKLQALFWVYSGTMGLSLSLLFMVFSGTDVARAFFITAADFGAMSLYGYTTRRDLTGMGAFMSMGLLGLIIAMVINYFLMSSALQWMVSMASVIIFTGLTAYHVQYFKQSYNEGWGAEANNKMAISAALTLYLDFINLFTSILRLTGGSRN